MSLLERLILWVVVVAAIAGGAWYAWTLQRDTWRADGAAACKAGNEAAAKARADEIAADRQDALQRDALASVNLRQAEKEIDRLKKERPSHVSQIADRACTLPLGFVFDHDAALSQATGRATAPVGAADQNRASGVSLSGASRAIGDNYAELGKCLKRLDAAEERRYQSCLAWDRKWGTSSGCARGGEDEAAGNTQPTKGR